MIFTDTMTVYSHHGGSWYRSVIPGVMWRHAKRQGRISKALMTEEVTESVAVDYNRPYDRPEYLPPKEYAALADPAGYWSLDPMGAQDIIVLGEVEDEITEEFTIEDIQQKYDYAVTVKAVSDNRNRDRLKHIKVVAY